MANITLLGASYTDVPAVDLPQTGGGTVRFYENGGGGSAYETIVPLQTINCAAPLSNDAYGGYINPYTSFTEEGEKYRVIFDGTTYEPLTATYYGSGTNYLYVGDPNVEASSSTTLIYPFEVMLLNGQTFYLGVKGSGSHTLQVDKIVSSGGGSATLITKTITANGTYSAEDDDADGYSSVTVNVPSSAASSWTKVAETSYSINATNTTGSTTATWETGHSELWTTEKILYVRVRDTAGKRAGYFYGSDNFFIGSFSGTSDSAGVRFAIYYNSSGAYGKSVSSSTTGYGVYVDTVYNDGRLRIRQRYHSSNSLTINGTYKVEVYLLDPPTGAPIFE